MCYFSLHVLFEITCRAEKTQILTFWGSCNRQMSTHRPQDCLQSKSGWNLKNVSRQPVQQKGKSDSKIEEYNWYFTKKGWIGGSSCSFEEAVSWHLVTKRFSHVWSVVIHSSFAKSGAKSVYCIPKLLSNYRLNEQLVWEVASSHLIYYARFSVTKCM